MSMKDGSPLAGISAAKSTQPMRLLLCRVRQKSNADSPWHLNVEVMSSKSISELIVSHIGNPIKTK